MNRRTFLQSCAAGLFLPAPMALYQIYVTGVTRPTYLYWFRESTLRASDFDPHLDDPKASLQFNLAFQRDLITANGMYAASNAGGGIYCAAWSPGLHQYITDPAAIAPDSGALYL